MVTALYEACTNWLGTYNCTYTRLDQGRAREVLLRPWVLYGELSQECLVVVGYNPASTITVADLARRGLTIMDYKEMLMDGEAFDQFYCSVTGKSPYTYGNPIPVDSHGRIRYLLSDLRRAGHSVLLTNVYAFPEGGEDAMDAFLKQHVDGRGVNPHESVLAQRLSDHLSHLRPALTPKAIVCMGRRTQNQMKRRGYGFYPMRHPGLRAEIRGTVPDWQTAVAAVVTTVSRVARINGRDQL